MLDRVSKDATSEIIQKRSKDDPRIIYIWAPENRSVVDAYLKGYRAALEADARWILEMDGGFSHHPEIIPQFIAKMDASRIISLELGS